MYKKLLFLALIIIVLSGCQNKDYNSQDFVLKDLVLDKISDFSFNNNDIVAGVAPHHLVAKDILQSFYEHLEKNSNPNTIVIIGPDHFNAYYTHGSNFITIKPQSEDFFGLEVDKQLIEDINSTMPLAFSNSSVKIDHAVRNHIDYIKKYLPKTKIFPVLIPGTITKIESDNFVDGLVKSNKNILVIASVDFSHYLSSEMADLHDLKSMRVIKNYEQENFNQLEVDSWQSLYIARNYAKAKGAETPIEIGHSNSYKINPIKSEEGTTSYYSVVFKKGEPKIDTASSMLFVGDIMLDRGVEYLMKKEGYDYPFRGVYSEFKGIDYVVGNLEGPVLNNPPDTGIESLQFAFNSKTIPELIKGHFNMLSLANNHTLNMNLTGLDETKSLLAEQYIDTIGNPISCEQNSFIVKGNNIFFAINKTYPFNCSNEKIVTQIKSLRKINPDKFIIVLIHWGNEYQLTSSLTQQKLAHQIIDSGADLIIGHHPHVVQNIEKYNNKLIFYSLGNFIFDQYQSKETQEGLAVGLGKYQDNQVYYLFPIDINNSQPILMEESAKEVFLENLAKRSKGLESEVKNGIIILNN